MAQYFEEGLKVMLIVENNVNDFGNEINEVVIQKMDKV